MNPKTSFLYSFLLLLIAFSAKSQHIPIPLNLDYDYQIEKLLYTSDSSFTAFKPILRSKWQTELEESNSFINTELLKNNSGKSTFSIEPIVHYQLFQSDKETAQGFGIGASANYSFSNKLIAGIDFAYFSIDYPSYQSEIISKTNSVPGLGTSGKYISAFINYSPSPIFDFQLGYGRNFIGDGYRSLLLSDYSAAYPYLKINTEIWKLKYTNLFSVQKNSFPSNESILRGATETTDRIKYTASHFLDFKATDWLKIGLFETVVWQREDSIFDRGFDVNYLNPVIFYRPLEFSTGSSDNVLMGLNLKARVAKKNVLYTQFIIDEFLVSEIRADIKQLMNPGKDIQSHWWANKYGIQLGWHAFDLLGIKGLGSRLEYNFVRPYMYAHSSPDQSYSHENLPLAHPLGANFQEALAHFDYYFGNWRLHFNYHYSIGGKSINTLNFGENVLASNFSRVKDYEVKTGQGLLYKTHYLNTGISYILDHEQNLHVQLGYLHRSHDIYGTENENYLYFKISTTLFNQYFDY